MTLSLSDVLTIATAAEWEAKILSFATTLGLTATAWQHGGVARTIIAVMANALSAVDTVVYGIACGGFLDTAADITPEGGPGWLDLVSQYVFDVTRTPTTQGTTSISVTNTGGAISLPAGTYHVKAVSSGHTYRNSAAITLATGATTVALVCDQFAANDPIGATTAAVSTYSNVTTGNLLSTAVGSHAESNLHLKTRCRNRLTTLAPKLGNTSSYYYFSTSTTEAGYPLPTTPITRANVTTNEVTGAVNVYLANASGAPSGGDVTLMQTYLDSVATPDGETMTCHAATGVAVNLAMQVWCSASYTSVVQAAVQAAFETRISGLDVGGEATEEGAQGVSFNGLEDAIAKSVTYIRTQTTTLNGVAASVTLATNEVATPGTVTVTRVGA